MFKIYDGREQFFQWDLDRKLVVEDASITEVHFCNRTAECALPVATYKEGNLTLVNVPNLILQESFRMNVYAYDGKHTKHAARFEIVPRSKPDTYVYTETEIKSWDDLFERVEQIEKNGVSDEAVEAAIEKYLEENDIRVDLTGYATEQYVQEQIAQIDIPEAGEEVHVGKEAPTDPDVKIWVDTDAESPVATKDYVSQKIAEAQMAGADVDLSAYYTKTEVDAKIETIELTPGPQGPAGKDGEPGKDGKDGQDGAPGADGKDYVLTEADKQEIADMVEVTGGEDVDLSNYYTKSEVDEKIAAIEIPEGDTEKLVLVNRENWTTGVSVPATNEEKEAWAQVEDGDTIHYEITDVTTGSVYSGKATASVDAYISIMFEEEALTEFVLSSGVIGFEATFATANVYMYKSTAATVDLSNYYTKEEVDALVGGTAEEIIWQGTYDANQGDITLSNEEIAKFIEIGGKTVSITFKNYDDNSEITFESYVFYDEYGATISFQGVDEATDSAIWAIDAYTDMNLLQIALGNDSQKADIKIFLPEQRDYYTKAEADVKMQTAINSALSAIGVAEEGAY